MNLTPESVASLRSNQKHKTYYLQGRLRKFWASRKTRVNAADHLIELQEALELSRELYQNKITNFLDDD